MKVSGRIFAAALLVIAIILSAAAAMAIQTEPATLNYQGTLTDNGGNPLTGSKNITIRLYTTLTGGTAFWSDTYTVTLLNGQFSVTLGSDANPLSSQLAQFNGVTYVGVQVDNAPEMTPRQKLTSVRMPLMVFRVVASLCGAAPLMEVDIRSLMGLLTLRGIYVMDRTARPDLRDRFIVGAGNSYAVGDTGGLASVPLETSHMPNHNHGGGNHTHPLGPIYGISGGERQAPFVNDNFGWTPYHQTGWSGNVIASEGGNQAHENRPPYYALAYIMKQ